MAALAQLLEHRHAIVIATDRLAVDQARAHSQCRYSLHDEREALGLLVPIAGEKPDSRGTAPRQEPVAIVLDLVNPVAAGRRPFDGAR
jgi:hypothetical protein